MRPDSALAEQLPPPQRLALAYAPRGARSAHLAVLALDRRLASAAAGRREPLAAQLRLAWWRETLGAPAGLPHGEPLLALLRDWRDPGALVPLVDGWEALLGEALTPAAIGEFVEGRARAFAALADELGVERTDQAAQAARTWALADLAANLSDPDERRLALDRGRGWPPPPRLPAALRPLAVLAGLGAAALMRGGGPLLAGPRSLLAALRIGWMGR